MSLQNNTHRALSSTENQVNQTENQVVIAISPKGIKNQQTDEQPSKAKLPRQRTDQSKDQVIELLASLPANAHGRVDREHGRDDGARQGVAYMRRANTRPTRTRSSAKVRR